MKQILIICLVLLLDPITIEAKKNPFGDGLYWDLTKGVLTISGHGPMPNEPDSYSNSFKIFPWKFYKYSDKIKTVVIEDGVTSVGIAAFKNINNIESVYLSKTVNKIEDYAFWSCKSLSKVVFSNGIQRIGKRAFGLCISLTSLNIPSSITKIDSESFLCCPINKIIVDENNPIYDSRNNCNAIIETAKSILVLGCSNTIIPNSVKIIGEYAFFDSNLTSITIPNSVNVINHNAFESCDNLKSVNFPEIISIDHEAFKSCSSLETVNICEGNISWAVFSNCENLKNVNIQKLRSQSLSPSVFEYCSNLRSINIPTGVTSIGNNAFQGCSSLTDVLIPKSVERIGEYAFAECPNFNLKIPNTVKEIGKCAFAHIDNNNKIIGYYTREIRCLPEWLSDKGEDGWKNIGINPVSAKKYFSRIYDNNYGQNANDLFEFTFPFMVKTVGNSKSIVYPQPGGVFKLVLNLSAEDKLKATLVEQNGLKTTQLLSLDKDINDAQLEIFTYGNIEGLIMEADEDEDNYTLAIYSKSKEIGYVFDLSASKLIEANYEQPDIVSKRVTHFFLKMDSKKPVEITTTEINGSPVYIYESNHYNMNNILYTKIKNFGKTIVLSFNDNFTIDDETGTISVTFHSRGNQFTGKVPILHNSESKAIYVIEREKDLMNWLCNNDVYEITINGITNEVFISAATIKALIEKMK